MRSYKIPKENITTIFHVLTSISHISNSNIKDAKEDQSYKKILSLFQRSKEKGFLNDELHKLYEENTKQSLRWLYLKRGRLVKSILGNQFKNYQTLKKRKNFESKNICAKIFKNRLKVANQKIHNKYHIIENDINLLKNRTRLTLQLSDEMLQVEVKDKNMLELYAVIVHTPKQQLLSIIFLDTEWDSFPLKWFSHTLPLSTVKDLLYLYKKGDDVSLYFSEKYKNNDFKIIEEHLDSPFLLSPYSHILCGRGEIIRQAIECYKQKIFSASICTALPMIEGIIWQFSKYIHSTEGGIYTSTDCTIIIDEITGKEIEKPTIGLLLKNTKLKNYFDKQFIEYFCDELYNERNPILHGDNTSYHSIENASKKIATIEYLLYIIVSYIKTKYLKKMETSIPKDTVENILKKISEQK